MNILEKLTTRRAERQKQDSASWAGFVADVCDERTTNADEILSALDRLNRTPEELQQACELLIQRRLWSRQVAEGSAAEREHSKAESEIDTEQSRFEKLEAAHREKLTPLQDRLRTARTAISTAADARRRLHETCSDQGRREAFADIDGQLSGLMDERALLEKSIQDKSRWIAEVVGLGEAAATPDAERLPQQRVALKELQARKAELGRQIDALQSARNRAADELLKPETI